ncbi:MAG: [FeFe] hydrogenase H-cluster radical SAM maturase HydG, partial [Rikenella sp.]|nr:[FeFe] hydrogenase H-cluster radical SAM maturase HydG [Rikenella sp.]
KRCCGPNAILTLAEYLADYASAEVAERGWAAIERALAELPAQARAQTSERLDRIRAGERDLYF